jgi:hypothetical protein
MKRTFLLKTLKEFDHLVDLALHVTGMVKWWVKK